MCVNVYIYILYLHVFTVQCVISTYMLFPVKNDHVSELSRILRDVRDEHAHSLSELSVTY